MANNFDDIKIISQNSQHSVYEITFKDFKIEEKNDDSINTTHKITYKNAAFSESANPYNLPSRILNIAIPHNGDVTIQLISKSQKSYNNINLKQSPQYQIENNQVDVLKPLTELGEKSRFRDFIYRPLIINNVSYDKNLRLITVIEKITIKLVFKGDLSTNKTFKKSGKLDDLYQDLFLNFLQAKDWQLKRDFKLAKSATLDDIKFYGIKVNEDGIYKVTSSFLQNNGIATNNLNINSIQLYNNGGYHLNLATTTSQFNPPYTQETAIKIFDLNNNNLFDNDDYFLFWGKSLNGWFYDATSDIFNHQTHSYAVENFYFLSVNGTAGKRMQGSGYEYQAGLAVQEYFIERFHHENDNYNLLNSGPDWYDYRFFGKSGSHFIDFDLNNLYGAGPSAEIDMRMKGGSRIKYQGTGSQPNYTYDFTISLNNTLLDLEFYDQGSIRFRNWSAKREQVSFSPALLINGLNRLTFNYSSNLDKSNVYLDWFSILYPKETVASDNYINFYSENTASSYNMGVKGFANINDLYLLDVTDPISPQILLSDYSLSSTEFEVTIQDSLTSKEFVAFSLGSPAIKNVNELRPYQPRNNLLDVTKSADFIIITRNSLLDYAHQIADIRDNLRTEVVSVEDINFFFNNGVQDPIAIRNFIRYAYNNWQSPSVSYVLLFGDGHYDYRNIQISDSIIVPTFQAYADYEVGSGSLARESDIFFGQLETSNSSLTQLKIIPSIAIGRLPIENALDAERVVEKLRIYKENPAKDGWQTYITLAADDEKGGDFDEWIHQQHADGIAKISGLKKYLHKKIYLSGYSSVAGGRGVLKPTATQELIDQINRGTLVLNYTGHGSPIQWAEETLFNFDRDYPKINNANKFPFIIAATCDFGIFDDPANLSFTEALIWKEKSGVIGVLTPTRLVYAYDNNEFARNYYQSLFPSNSSSRTLGDAFVLALNLNTDSENVNDQKFHLLADPSMYLADARSDLEITSVSPDTLKALSNVEIQARVTDNGQLAENFNGGAVYIVNDAAFEDVNTGGGTLRNYDLNGPLIFKGEVSVRDGLLTGNFIVPKTIRYNLRNTGRVTFYAWDETTNLTAGGFLDNLLFYGSSTLAPEEDGPQIDIYFEDFENFDTGDMLPLNPILIAELSDESGINMTGQLGHKIELQIDDNNSIDISESFVYNRDSYKSGLIHYPLPGLSEGEHAITLQAFDNLNNRSEAQVLFRIIDNDGIILRDVVNYPNPFRKNTEFTFRTNISGAEYSIKIYTLSGRLIEKLEGITDDNYNSVPWSGLDRDGNELANGVYIYKLLLKYNSKVKEKIEKMVVLR